MGGPTESLTLNLSEWTGTRGQFHSDGGVSSLSDVLETRPLPPQYYLTGKACGGILDRADGRSKTLPPLLEAVLESVAGRKSNKSAKDPAATSPQPPAKVKAKKPVEDHPTLL